MGEPVVLVTGATGLVGRRLTRALQRDGFCVRALSRSAANAGLPEGVEVLDWNGRNARPEAIFRTHAIVHLSGEPVFAGRLTRKRKRRIRDSRLESTRSLAAALAALPDADRPQTFLCASAVGYYGSRGDDLLEESERAGDDFLSLLCKDWEEVAAQAASTGVRTASLRFGIVLAAEGGALAAMRLPFRLGLGGLFGDGRQWFPWIHIDDAVALIVAALRDDRYRGAVNLVAPNPVTNADLTRALGRALGRRTIFRIPAFALRAALGELSGELLGSRRVVPRVATDCGFAFRYATLEEALSAEL